MPYTINITPSALDDIQCGVDYYNSRAAGLGFRFADEVDNSLNTIAKIPNAFSYRYKNVRAALTDKFPYLIFFIINESSFTVDVIRIFNTYQQPFYSTENI